MKFAALAIMAWLGFAAWAQEPVSSEYDAEIQSLIDKVESKDREKAEFINEYKPENELQKKVSQTAERYVRALVEEDWDTSYSLLNNAYRDKITLAEYRGHKRLESKKGIMKEVLFEGDACALARVQFWGDAPGGMGLLKIPLKVFMFIEDGEWRVFRNPYENHMGVSHPRGRHIKYPCDFSNRRGQAKKK